MVISHLTFNIYTPRIFSKYIVFISKKLKIFSPIIQFLVTEMDKKLPLGVFMFKGFLPNKPINPDQDEKYHVSLQLIKKRCEFAKKY